MLWRCSSTGVACSARLAARHSVQIRQRYDSVRPAYPAWVFEELVERGALRPGAVTFEIGAGTGIATRALLAYGAHPRVAIELDARLAAFLRAGCSTADVRVAAFEDCPLDPAVCDLGFCATAFTGPE